MLANLLIKVFKITVSVHLVPFFSVPTPSSVPHYQQLSLYGL